MAGVMLTLSHRSPELEEGIRKLGFEPVIAPMLQIVEVQGEAPDFSGYGGLVFTSANGVREMVKRHGSAAREKLVYAVGPQTCAAASEAGFQHIIQGEGRAEDLVRMVAARTPAGRILHVRGEDAAFPLVQSLTEAGIIADNYVIYRAVPVSCMPDEAMEGILCGEIFCVMFHSARAGANFTRIVSRAEAADALKKTNALCLGVRVLKSIEFLPWAREYAADRPSREGMLEMLGFLKKGS